MPTLSDAIIIATGGPTIQDGLRRWYLARGATSGAIQDLERQFLDAQIVEPIAGHSNQDLWMIFLEQEGYTGTLNDRQYQYWTAEGDLPPFATLWYDFSDASLLYSDTAGTNPVPGPVNGIRVGSAQSVLGAGPLVVAPANNQRPRFAAGVQNGLGGLQFIAGAEESLLGGMSAFTKSEYSIYTVWRLDSPGQVEGGIISLYNSAAGVDDGNSNSVVYKQNGAGDGGEQFIRGAGAGAHDVPAVSGIGSVLLMEGHAHIDEVWTVVGGVESARAAYTPIALDANRILVGARFNGAVVDFWSNLTLCEIRIYGALTEGQINLIRTLIRQKWLL